ncbi:MAG TPA: outer membrane beta-barrel protein [Longimicrobiales bacterium]|nr:outer membrane beta-barrel protein [Longimicrobiales bacterium]
MSIKLVGWTAALALAVGASSSSAQVPAIDFTLFPRAGLYQSLGNLAEVNGDEIKLESGPAFGASAELALMFVPVSFRVGFDYVLPTGSTTNEVSSTDEDNTILMVTGDIVLRLAPGVSPIQAYLMAGGGTKRYEFKNMPNVFESSQSSFTGHLGAGLSLKLGPLGIGAEVSDYISSFKPEFSTGDSKLQNDVFLMAGLRIAIF